MKHPKYRLGIVDPAAKWAARYSHVFRDNIKWLKNSDRMKIGEYVDLSVKHKFLEIGPQTCWRTFAPLYFTGQDMTALDLWRYYPVWSLFKKAKFVLSDAGRVMPFADESFNHCVFMGVISYLADPLSCLREINRVLSTNGFLFLSCNSKNSYCLKKGMLDPVMKTFWDERDAGEALRSAGFVVQEIYSWGFPETSARDKIMSDLQKFFTMEFFQAEMAKKYHGVESFVYCIARKV